MALKIAIIGGSVGGLFAAVLLDRAGFDVQVHERSRAGHGGRGAGLVAQHAVFRLLREIGCEHVARVGVTARERIFLDRDGSVAHRVQTPQTQISWDLLWASLRRALPEGRYANGRVAEAVRQGPTEASVRFADGTTVSADLVIAADGLGSVLRGAVAGAAARPVYAGYAAWRGLVPETALVDEASMLSERFAFYQTPGSQTLGYLVPGADGSVKAGHRRYNWVWYRPADGEAALAAALTDRDGRRHDHSLPPGAMSDPAVDRLRRDAARLLPPAFARVIGAEPVPFVQAIHDLRSPRMVSGRIALLGDAAFVARPHTAMGVAKAAADAMALRDRLVGQADPVAALALYEQDRFEENDAIVSRGIRLGQSLQPAVPEGRSAG
ncbi:MAG: 2-polyprenyl-6-methoxyphenol hydroxylase [Maritimibacter sp.]|nr:2-polyprenyl-6-methoxyphenol hydroxylase [Maritimibacter sp.]